MIANFSFERMLSNSFAKYIKAEVHIKYIDVLQALVWDNNVAVSRSIQLKN